MTGPGPLRIAAALTAGVAAAAGALAAMQARAGPVSAAVRRAAGAVGLDGSARWHMAGEWAAQGVLVTVPAAIAYGAVLAAAPGHRLRPLRLAAASAGLLAAFALILLAGLTLRLLGLPTLLALAAAYAGAGAWLGGWVAEPARGAPR